MSTFNYDMGGAPKDGRFLLLHVVYRDGEDHRMADDGEAVTVGYNNTDTCLDDEDWHLLGWCWSHDHFTDQGKGTPIGWMEMPTADKRGTAQ